MKIFQDASTTSHRRTTPRRGFTLLEVLISITLVLLIILGVNQVFSLTSQAVGAGNALSEQVRNHRSAQAILSADLGNAEIDRAPFFIINSEVIAAFRNRAEQVADLDYVPANTSPSSADTQIRSIDADRDGTETAGERVPRAFMGPRTHRADMLRFFSRFQGRRQSGTSTSFNSWVSSGEHYIVYGHLRQPDNNPANQLQAGREPGMGRLATAETPASNPNNFYATQWVLGRSAFVLQQPRTDGNIYDARTNQPIEFYDYQGTAGDGDFSPFRFDSNTKTGGSSKIQWSHYDVMGVQIGRYRNEVMTAAVLSTAPTSTNWHDQTNGVNFRFTGYQFPARPLSTEGVSRTVPCFIPACTQFVVEFAGDFMAQDLDPASGTYGALQTVADGLGGGTDNQIDFNVTSVNGIPTRSIRWYGFPRDTNRDGFIRKTDGDVVPLRDHAGGVFLFERVLPTTSAATDYGTEAAIPLAAQYRCAWAADTAALPRPKMIRIVIGTDDPAARLATEQFSEFVVELP